MAGLAVGGFVPAGAEGDDDVASLESSEETTETTAPPDTTPETMPPGTTPPEDPPAPPADDPPADDPPPEGLLTTQEFTILGHVDPPDPLVACQGAGQNSWESDPRADPNGQCTFGNFEPPNNGVCTDFWASSTTFFSSGTSGNDGKVQGTVSAHDPAGEQVGVGILDASVVIDGVVVKGGNAYNRYDGVEANMIPPLTGKNGNFADISHFVICYHLDESETGELDVTKTVVGPVSGGTTFTVDVDCTDDDFDTTLVFDSAGDLDSGGPLPIVDIPVGTQCTVTETGTGGADSVTYSPDGGSPTDPPTVTIETDGQTVTVAITNTFDEPETGSIEVLKVTEGVVGAATEFVVTVDCDGLAPIPLTFTSPGDLGPKSVDDVPVGTTCDVEETQNGGATLVTYVPNGGTEQDPPTVTVGDVVALVTVTNFFPGGEATGSVEVTKAVNGTPPDGATYQVRVFCTDGTDETLQFGAGGGSQILTGIQIPASCTVEETGQGGASSVTYTPQDTTFALTIETPARDLTVTNIFDPQAITVGGIEVGRPGGGTLAFTGSPITTLAMAAALLLGIGATLTAVGRRRRRSMAA